MHTRAHIQTNKDTQMLTQSHAYPVLAQMICPTTSIVPTQQTVGSGLEPYLARFITHMRLVQPLQGTWPQNLTAFMSACAGTVPCNSSLWRLWLVGTRPGPCQIIAEGRAYETDVAGDAPSFISLDCLFGRPAKPRAFCNPAKTTARGFAGPKAT